jgi:hypothetical protein
MPVIGFPDEGLLNSSAFPNESSEKCEIDDFRRFSHFFIGFPEKIASGHRISRSHPPFPMTPPQNPSDFRPSDALLIEIRSAGLPLTHTHTHTPSGTEQRAPPCLPRRAPCACRPRRRCRGWRAGAGPAHACVCTSGSAKDLGGIVARPVPHGRLPRSHPARGFLLLRKSVKMPIFTLFGPKFSRSHPAARAPVCPFSPRKRTFAGGGGANGNTGVCANGAHCSCVGWCSCSGCAISQPAYRDLSVCCCVLRTHPSTPAPSTMAPPEGAP